MSRPARPEDVDEICAALPSTEFGTSWGDVPTWLVPAGDKGRGFVLYRPAHPSAVDPVSGEQYDDLLVVRTADAGDKAALVEGDSPFFTIDHFRNFNAVLVQQSRLGELSLDELTEVVHEAWLAVAPKRLCREFLADD
ncbi:hypothetical protein [Nocardioides sp.]|uniref:hypothetical protein n=1 Tax=Nocardioides sp. TaxID=35761 RepID=UPI002B6701B1|nr:hypothetical protein [Nocardioides sp.]HXH79380.1 hypothetical protein [Nocardioides sp.]